jgi:orotidine-5'-phosphate decarboxylase
MYVVGATKADHLSEIRALVPNSFLLVPGVGAQGGSLLEVYKNGANAQVGLLVNSSRNILYASDGKNYPAAALAAATELQQQMAKLLNK